MKQLLMLLAGCWITVAAFAQQTRTLSDSSTDSSAFVVRGNISGAVDGTFAHFLYYDEEQQQQHDSILLVSGAFEYRGKARYPKRLFLTFTEAGMQGPRLTQLRSLFIEPGFTDISGDISNIQSLVIKGGQVQAELEAFDRLTIAPREAIRPLSDRYEAKNLEYMEAKKANKPEGELEQMKAYLQLVHDSMEPFYEQIRVIQLDYIGRNPDSFISASQLRYFVGQMNYDQVARIYQRMSEAVQQSPDGKQIARDMKRLLLGSPGSKATSFSGSDINGLPLRLEDFRGKYVLVDFWASWCVPCRRGNPHLRRIYSAYKHKGFEIIGIADDDSNPRAWRQAVQKDSIGVWKHVLRGLKRTEGGYDRSEDKSEAYGIYSLPTKILIDPQGIIIGRYGGEGEDDEALDKKLAAIFK